MKRYRWLGAVALSAWCVSSSSSAGYTEMRPRMRRLGAAVTAVGTDKFNAGGEESPLMLLLSSDALTLPTLRGCFLALAKNLPRATVWELESDLLTASWDELQVWKPGRMLVERLDGDEAQPLLHPGSVPEECQEGSESSALDVSKCPMYRLTAQVINSMTQVLVLSPSGAVNLVGDGVLSTDRLGKLAEMDLESRFLDVFASIMSVNLIEGVQELLAAASALVPLEQTPEFALEFEQTLLYFASLAANMETVQQQDFPIEDWSEQDRELLNLVKMRRSSNVPVHYTKNTRLVLSGDLPGFASLVYRPVSGCTDASCFGSLVLADARTFWRLEALRAVNGTWKAVEGATGDSSLPGIWFEDKQATSMFNVGLPPLPEPGKKYEWVVDRDTGFVEESHAMDVGHAVHNYVKQLEGLLEHVLLVSFDVSESPWSLQLEAATGEAGAFVLHFYQRLF